MLFSYKCSNGHKWEVEKGLKDPAPKKCPNCGEVAERDFAADGTPSVLYPGRPIWTYKDCLKYKDCRIGDGPRTKIDPSKHGDIGAWHCPGEVVPFNKDDAKKAKKKQNIRKLGG